MSRTTFNLQTPSTVFYSLPSLDQKCKTFLASGNSSSYAELNAFLAQSPSAIKELVSIVEEAINSSDRICMQQIFSHPQLKAHFLLTKGALLLNCYSIFASHVGDYLSEPSNEVVHFPLTDGDAKIVAEFLG